jgi:hypothetical protein
VVKRLFASSLVLLMLFGFASNPGLASNQGTVKIDGVPFDQVEDNEPHPGCVFKLQFFGFPEGTEASYQFAVYPPTSNTNGPGTLIAPPGEVDLTLPAPGARRLNLNTGKINLKDGLTAAGVSPHPLQGFHVKLTVTTPGGHKYKVFWVECDTNPYDSGF